MVDDEPHIRLYLRQILKTLEIPNIEEVNSGEAGLKALEANVPDFVILDINLLGMTGIEIVSAIRQKNFKLPIVMFTAQATRETVEACRDAGADFFIRKDTPRAEITTHLKDFIAQIARSNTP